MAGQIHNRQTFEEGRTIFSAGDAPHCAYLIQSGAVNIVVSDGESRTVVDTLAPGEVFGEMALVDDHPRAATAVAKSLATCVLISKTDFNQRVDQADSFTRSMLMLLTKRLRNTLPAA